MSLLSTLFTPAGSRFYLLFNQVGDNLQEMAKLLVRVMGDISSEERTSTLAKMERLEHENDTATHRLFVELGRNFITPFDREDIHSLSGTLDDIIDYMLAVAKMLKNYDLQGYDAASGIVADGMLPMMKELALALKGLKNKTALNELNVHCRQIRKMVARLDNEVDTAIADLLRSETDPMMVIKKMDHYDLQQTLIGKCADAVNVIESVIIKYG